jgi:hypothetical protein
MQDKYYNQPRSFVLRLCLLCLMAAVVLVVGVSVAFAQDCPEEPPLQNYTGGGTVVCPCFVAGEEAGAVLEAPTEHYPIEILTVGIGWGSLYGGTGQSIEQAIHVYDAGLPNPGTPIFTLEGPVLNDGFINVFDLEPAPGEIIVDSGPFTVTLEFMNSNAGDPYAPSMVHDGNGCQTGKNAVYAIPGGWWDACALGISGDWVVYAVYRQVNCSSSVSDEATTCGVPYILTKPEPNPFVNQTQFELIIARSGRLDLSLYDIRGRKVATLAYGTYPAGRHTFVWSGKDADGVSLASGVYFAIMRAGAFRSTRPVVLNR